MVHLGGGAFTLARYIAATRPRSTQQVIEVDAALVELVRREMPLDPQARIRVRATDARAGLGKIQDGWADLVIADVFSGARTPAHLTSTEFLAEVRRVLKPGGSYVANLADGPPLTHLRGQIATAATVFPELALAADPTVWRGRRFGNAVLLASDLPLKVAELTRRVATDPHPGRVEHGRALADFTGGAAAVNDADARPSPAPPPRPSAERPHEFTVTGTSCTIGPPAVALPPRRHRPAPDGVRCRPWQVCSWSRTTSSYVPPSSGT